MSSLPASVPYAKVTGWFNQAVADSPEDADRDPDVLPMSGTITFTPNVARARIAGTTPQPMTVFPKPISCQLDEQGFLQGPDGTKDVVLIATGDLIPSYTVMYELDGISRFSQSIVLPANTIVDLATALEVPSSPSTALSQWLAAATRAEAAADRAEAALAAMQAL